MPKKSNEKKIKRLYEVETGGVGVGGMGIAEIHGCGCARKVRVFIRQSFALSLSYFNFNRCLPTISSPTLL